MKKYKIVRYKKKTLYSELEVVYLDQWPSWPRPGDFNVPIKPAILCST